ncbi:hypothetical protein QTP88_028124 [Uroleucon formosanum]
MTETDKKKLLVIGKSKNPRCFKGVSSIPVFYENNTKAWMTSAIFEKTLNYLDDELRRFCDVLTDTTQLQADSVLINDIDEDNVQIDDDIITPEIQTDEDIVNNVITSQQVEPNNDTDINELDDEFKTVPSISKARVALRVLEKFYYTKYEGTDAERKALSLLETSINTKYTKQSSIKNYFKKLNSSVL